MMGKYSILDEVKKEGRSILTEFESKGVLRRVGIPVVETRLAKNQKETVSIGQRIGFPVVLKITSPDVVHKTDSGGGKLGLKNASEVKKAYDDILRSVKKKDPRALIHGISAQKVAPPGTQVIIGTSNAPEF